MPYEEVQERTMRLDVEDAIVQGVEPERANLPITKNFGDDMTYGFLTVGRLKTEKGLSHDAVAKKHASLRFQHSTFEDCASLHYWFSVFSFTQLFFQFLKPRHHVALG